MSILTKTNRKETYFEGTSMVSDKVGKGYQPRTQCCKQISSSDEERATQYVKLQERNTRRLLLYKADRSPLANITIKA